MRPESTSEAIAYYHELLQGPLLGSTREMLARALAEPELAFLGQPACTMLRPSLVPAAVMPEVEAAASRVAQALDIAVRRVLADGSLRALLGLSPEEERLVQLDAGEPVEVVGRMDGFLGDDSQIRFIEFNPGAPGGVVFCDLLCELFSRLPIMEAFSRRFRTSWTSMRERVAGALLSAYRHRGGQGLPSVAFLLPPRESRRMGTLAEVTTLERLIQTMGGTCCTAPVEAIECAGDAVHAAGQRVDVVFVASWSHFVAEVHASHPFWRVLARGGVWILNSPTTKILRGHNAMLALLTDHRFAFWFDAETREVLVRHLPWTRRLVEGRTELGDGRTVDLLPWVRDNREGLVLKPASGYGGTGVTLGWECCGDAAWQQALERGLAGSFVVQERVPIRREPYPFLVDGELVVQELAVDLDPFIWNGRQAAGMMMRTSSSDLMNVSAGTGSLTAPLIVEAVS